jgi:hypothetical protein
MAKVLRCRDVGMDCDFVAQADTEEESARSRGSNPWQTQVMALGGPLLSHFPLDPIA